VGIERRDHAAHRVLQQLMLVHIIHIVAADAGVDLG
jgi:hypothetical protein